MILENERGSILKASIVRECSDPIENLQILRSSELRRTLVMSLYGVARLNVIPTNIMVGCCFVIFSLFIVFEPWTAFSADRVIRAAH